MLELEGDVALAGDWHGNVDYIHSVVRHIAENYPHVRYIIALGDLYFWKFRDLAQFEKLFEKANLMLYWIDGNHENHDLIATLERDRNGLGYVSPHIRHIPRGELFLLNGEKWIGLGGTASINTKYKTPWVNWWPNELITRDDAMVATSHGCADVFISHDVAYGVPTIEERVSKVVHRYPRWEIESSLQQRKLLREIVEMIQPHRIYHGHHHIRYEDFLVLDNWQQVKVSGLGRDGGEIEDNIIVL